MLRARVMLMAWIEVHQALPNHRKLLLAANELGIAPVPLMGHLVALWLWALDNAPSGRLEGIPNSLIASACQWKKGAVKLVFALTSSGLLDDDHGTLVIHDWQDYAGRLIAKRTANVQRMRVARAAHVHSMCDARAGATVPNSTVPNSTVPLPLPLPKAKSARKLAEKRPFSEEVRQALLQIYSRVASEHEINEHIEEGLAHTAAKKWHDQYLYLRGWLRREFKGRTNGTKAAPTPEEEAKPNKYAILAAEIAARKKAWEARHAES